MEQEKEFWGKFESRLAISSLERNLRVNLTQGKLVIARKGIWGKFDPRLASYSKKRNLGVNLTQG